MRDGPRRFAQNFSCSALLRCRLGIYGPVSRTGLSPSAAALSSAFRYRSTVPLRRSYNPARCVATPAVWALARSLATTGAIILIFSSCGYWDVSVPRVRPTCSCRPWTARAARVSPFGHPRVDGHLPLTAAFRSLSRPSSPPRATGIPHAPFSAFLFPFNPADGSRRRGAQAKRLSPYNSFTVRSILV